MPSEKIEILSKLLPMSLEELFQEYPNEYETTEQKSIVSEEIAEYKKSIQQETDIRKVLKEVIEIKKILTDNIIKPTEKQ